MTHENADAAGLSIPQASSAPLRRASSDASCRIRPGLPGGQPAILAQGLTKSYQDTHAVRGIDLEVRAGEVFGFLGPNGAGKSTTIAMLTTLARPTSGGARVAGADVVTEAAVVRRRIGLVFQDSTLDGDLTAEENLRFHSILYGMPARTAAARIIEMLELTGLADQRQHLVRTFSGGMKRRLEIARGLLHIPQVLFLDEPTLGLDPHARADLWSHLREIRSRHAITLFLTTHYLEEAEHCDRIAIVDHGRVIAQDTPAGLKAAIGADHIHVRTADDDAAQRQLVHRLGLTATRHPDGLTVRVPEAASALPGLCAALTVRVTSIEVTRPSLDDVYMHFTGHSIHAHREGHRSGVPPATAPRGEGDTTGNPVETPAAHRRVSPRDLGVARIVWQREMMRFARDRTRLLFTLLQPALYLLLLGTGLAALIPHSKGVGDYRTYLFPGILLMTVQISAISTAASIVVDREAGFLREMMVAPVRRATLLAGKCFGATTVATCQGVVVLALLPVAQIPYDFSLIILLIAEMALVSLALTALTALLSVSITRTETFHIVLGFALMPMTFLSGAMFPLAGLPTWLTVLTLANPLTYMVDLLRQTVHAHLPSHTDTGVYWSLGSLPIVAELSIIAVIGLLSLALAARGFSRTR